MSPPDLAALRQQAEALLGDGDRRGSAEDLYRLVRDLSAFLEGATLEELAGAAFPEEAQPLACLAALANLRPWLPRRTRADQYTPDELGRLREAARKRVVNVLLPLERATGEAPASKEVVWISTRHLRSPTASSSRPAGGI
ncbi:hypothetical protein [Deinococcus phoenicis]|uniref:hypothetical protein n=1 Tax=Deinococcus phoenicis TaxID=1476583 RepID=UPI0004B11D5A|nr:hypothetical protein [Deinococcus phoenicis]